MHSLFAISGLGGGIILVPVYISLGIAVPIAASAGLLMNIISLSIITGHNSRHRIVKWKLGTAFLAPAIVLTPIGELAETSFPREYVLIVFVLLLTLAFVHITLKRSPSHQERLKGRSSIAVAVPVGLITGFLSGLTGIGGGMIVLPALTFMEEDYRNIIGTTAYVALALSVVSLISHIQYLHLFTLDLWTVILSGSIMGGIIASYLIHTLDSGKISRVTGIVILAVMGILLYQIF